MDRFLVSREEVQGGEILQWSVVVTIQIVVAQLTTLTGIITDSTHSLNHPQTCRVCFFTKLSKSLILDLNINLWNQNYIIEPFKVNFWYIPSTPIFWSREGLLMCLNVIPSSDVDANSGVKSQVQDNFVMPHKQSSARSLRSLFWLKYLVLPEFLLGSYQQWLTCPALTPQHKNWAKIKSFVCLIWL